jgi:alpha-ketoglutaric semialdehyde dehydrogenase
MTESSGLSIIGAGRGVPGGKSFRAFDPTANTAYGAEFISASSSDIEQATALAAKAAPAFARSGSAQRAILLESIASHIETALPALIEIIPRETGLPEARVRNETARTCMQLRLFASVLRDGDWLDARIDHGDPTRNPPQPDLRSMQRALGPVAVFGASNFPLAFSVAGGDTASALAAGCPVIVKAHPAHPGTSEIIGLAIQTAIHVCGMNSGIFSMLFDAQHRVGTALVKHPVIQAVGFTGSQRGGRLLLALAAQRQQPIPVYAEMGSVNPIFILPGALAARAETIADGLQASVMLACGQFCTSPGLVFAAEGAGYEGLRTRLKSLFAESNTATMLTPGIAEAYRHGIKTLAQLPGVDVLAQHDSSGSQGGPALLETDVATLLTHPELAEEVFGPSTVLVRAKSAAQLTILAEHLDGQLTATVHAEVDELDNYGKLLDALQSRVGRVLIGGFPTGVEVNHAMIHGGPWPASSDSRSTSVGSASILRWVRPVALQNFPDTLLPPELQEKNPLQLRRLVDGKFSDVTIG